MITKMLLRKLVSVVQGLTHVTYATSTGSTIVIPSDAAIGDFAILWDAAESSAIYPSTVTPSGWTAVNNVLSNVNPVVARIISNRKKLVSGDPGATITGMNGDLYNNKIMFIMRPNKAIGTFTEYEAVNAADMGDPADQVKATQTAPYVIIGASYCDAAPAWSSAWYEQSVASNRLLAALKIFNSSPASTTVGIDVTGTDNMLLTCSIQVT